MYGVSKRHYLSLLPIAGASTWAFLLRQPTALPVYFPNIPGHLMGFHCISWCRSQQPTLARPMCHFYLASPGAVSLAYTLNLTISLRLRSDGAGLRWRFRAVLYHSGFHPNALSIAISLPEVHTVQFYELTL